MIDPHTVHKGGVKVIYVDWVFDDVVAEVVRLAQFNPALDASTCHPHGKALGMMVAAVVFFG